MHAWETITGRHARTWEGHKEDIYVLTLTPDDRYLLSGSADAGVPMWEPARDLVEARSGRAAEVEADHLLVGTGTLCRPDLPCFARAGISPRRLRRGLREALAVEGGAGGGVRQLSRAARRALVQPLTRALLTGDIPDSSTVRANAAGEALSLTTENP